MRLAALGRGAAHENLLEHRFSALIFAILFEGAVPV